MKMRKIINGVRYDTDSAELIGDADNIGCGATSQNDFSWWEAGLYITPRSGRYFLAGTGGPMSRFGHAIDNNSTSGGSKLIPMEKSEALEWAEQYLDTETVEEYFADMIKDA